MTEDEFKTKYAQRLGTIFVIGWVLFCLLSALLALFIVAHFIIKFW